MIEIHTVNYYGFFAYVRENARTSLLNAWDSAPPAQREEEDSFATSEVQAEAEEEEEDEDEEEYWPPPKDPPQRDRISSTEEVEKVPEKENGKTSIIYGKSRINAAMATSLIKPHLFRFVRLLALRRTPPAAPARPPPPSSPSTSLLRCQTSSWPSCRE